MLVNRGRDALQECESRLRGLLAEAAAAGHYEAVLQLTEWARGVAALETVRPPAIGAGKNSNPTGHHEDDGRDHVSSSARTPEKKSTRRRKKKGVRQTQRKRKAIAAAYPKFARFNDELVKIGWSKKAKKEYQHRAPRRVVDCLVDRLMELAAPDELFSTEELFPLCDKDGDSEIPSYQAYLCLAWLREQNLIEQVGRQGYRLADSTSLRDTVERQWRALPRGGSAAR